MIQDLRGQIDQQASDMADLNRRLDRVCQERDSAEAACDHLESEIRRAGDEIQDLQVSLADREREVDMVRDELSTTLNTLDRVRSALQRAESASSPISPNSTGHTATLRAERDAAFTEARRITASLDRTTADLRQATTDRDAARAEVLDLRNRSASPGPDQPPAKRSHSSPPPDRTPTSPPFDHADREGDSTGSGREASQKDSGGGTDQSSPDRSEIKDDGGGQHSPDRLPIREDVEEHHTPEPSESGHEDQGSSASNQSSEGEAETERSADSTDDEILAARSRSRSEVRRGSVPLGGANQPIDLSGTAGPSRLNSQDQPPPSPGSQHYAGQSPPRTRMILSTLTKRLVTAPGRLFSRKVRRTAVPVAGTEYRDDLITGAHVQDLLHVDSESGITSSLASLIVDFASFPFSVLGSD
ncbi:unnamed protein product [Phytophthora fragariaefolia]|uniref:Unnamed protein product n=1 Tax=Phytophthora fragariaefolia TaxID=1490495 RepID=A0A9W7D1B4_9STRA|nr:unnamed protein product [Phytophthora fragariaefolia]